MQRPKSIKKCLSPRLQPTFFTNLQQIRESMQMRMIKQYSTSQEYFYKRSIDDLIQKKQGDRDCIRSNDFRFDDDYEHIQKLYRNDQSQQELPELLEYYKYYSQESLCFFHKEFSFLAVHHEKKKAVLYEQLKKQLNISDSQSSIEQISKKRISEKYENVLSGLQLTETKDQSYFVNEILKKLVNHYGPSRTKTLGKLDCQFKFMTHNLNIGKKKVQSKEVFNPQESTSASVRNNPYLKGKGAKNTHRRFESCEVPKTSNLKIREKQRKGNKVRRRKSMQLIPHYESHTIFSSVQKNKKQSMEKHKKETHDDYKKESLQSQQHNKSTKSQFSSWNFKERMEQIRSKIRKQKQILIKKPQNSTCASRKKLRK